MWVDPDSGKTWEQIAEQVWQSLPQDLRARYDALCQATGQTREALCQEAHARFQERLAQVRDDPDSTLAKALDRFQFPFGKDPRLERAERPPDMSG